MQRSTLPDAEHPQPIAGATQERPLEAVGCKPKLDSSLFQSSQLVSKNGCHLVPCFGAEKLLKMESLFSITTTNGYR